MRFLRKLKMSAPECKKIFEEQKLALTQESPERILMQRSLLLSGMV